jgi:hypothetical protein
MTERVFADVVVVLAGLIGIGGLIGGIAACGARSSP